MTPEGGGVAAAVESVAAAGERLLQHLELPLSCLDVEELVYGLRCDRTESAGAGARADAEARGHGLGARASHGAV